METDANYTLIKSKNRVQKHGEVFTPKNVINKMLNLPGIAEACESITATFLEPAAGEGAFLVEILKRKLAIVAKKFNRIDKIENYSLLALSTLYGIELLEDNALACAMNMYHTYYDFYTKQISKYGSKIKKDVLESSKTIIYSNIEQGNFLTRRKSNGEPIILSEWKPINLRSNTTNIKVIRTEYTLDEILNKSRKTLGEVYRNNPPYKQLSIFDFLTNENSQIMKKNIKKRFVITNITKVYLQELEEFDEEE